MDEGKKTITTNDASESKIVELKEDKEPVLDESVPKKVKGVK